MSQKDAFNHKFKRAITSNFNVSGEDTDRLEAQCGLFGWLTKRLLILVPPLHERSILDVGCGTGISTRVILDSVENNVSIFGVDISRGMIEKAELKCPEPFSAWVMRNFSLIYSLCRLAGCIIPHVSF